MSADAFFSYFKIEKGQTRTASERTTILVYNSKDRTSKQNHTENCPNEENQLDESPASQQQSKTIQPSLQGQSRQ